jgi:hypothetical protein
MKTLLTFVVVAVGCAQAQDSQHDVQIVRALYDKLVLGYRIVALFNQQHQATSAPNAPQFELTSIRSGPVSEILLLPVSNVQTKPSTPVLSAGLAGITLQLENGTTYETTGTQAQWGTSGNPPEDWNTPLARWFVMTSNTDFTRYVAVDVKLSFEGRSRSYKAFFLFKEDAGGRTIVHPGDLITGSVLDNLLGVRMVPGPLLHYQDRPAVQAFFATAAIPHCTFEPVTRMCCDPATGRCGIDPHVLH